MCETEGEEWRSEFQEFWRRQWVWGWGEVAVSIWVHLNTICLLVLITLTVATQTSPVWLVCEYVSSQSGVWLLRDLLNTVVILWYTTAILWSHISSTHSQWPFCIIFILKNLWHIIMSEKNHFLCSFSKLWTCAVLALFLKIHMQLQWMHKDTHTQWAAHP